MAFRICAGCKIRKPIEQFKCEFRIASPGFKNCCECRKGYRYYINKRTAEKNAYSDYKTRKSVKRLKKQCFDCLWLYDKFWICEHDNIKKYMVYNNERRAKIQKIDDYKTAYDFFLKMRGSKSINKNVKPINKDPISPEKFKINIFI